MHVLIIEDEDAIASKLGRELARAGYRWERAGTVAEGLRAVELGVAELVLLDLMLPDGTGFDLLARIRAISRVPVIVVSARLLGDDKVRALSLGADDYVTKPFWIAELLARIAAVMRRHHAVPGPRMRYRFDDAVVDLTAMSVEVGDRPAELTPTEFDLLAYLLQHPGEALTVDRLIERVLGEGAGSADALRVHVSRVRKKLGDAGARIETVWGVGYRFRPPEAP